MKILTKTIIAVLAASITAGTASADNDKNTDAYIKLYDNGGKHPRIVSITFPGNANILDMYNSIYGHGAVIENPWVAYRIYMDNRQSLDLYVKATPRLELDITGFYTTSEQLNKGYGCDVLWAGKSISAGSFRGWQNRKPVTIDSVGTRRQTVIDNRTIEVFDKDWIFNGHPIQMRQLYSVKPDSRELSVEIQLDGYKEEDLFATGIQKLETGNEGFIEPDGIAASWGDNIPDKNHKELIERVGLGIKVASENIVDIVEDELNYIIIVKPDKNGKIKYHVLSCGNREEKGFATMNEWFEYVRMYKIK